MEIFDTLKFNPAANETKYEEVLKKIGEEFCPKKNVTYEILFKFNSYDYEQSMEMQLWKLFSRTFNYSMSVMCFFWGGGRLPPEHVRL